MVIYPVRAAANGPSRYSIVDKRGFPLSTLGHHQERIAEAIAEAINAAYVEVPEQ
jgi:hypothetical protein